MGGRVTTKGLGVSALAVAFLFAPVRVSAHHGASEYDMTKVVSLQATVTDFQFVNPHTLVDFNVKDDAGKVSEWQGELLAQICWCAAAGARMCSRPATR